jgi:sulfate permease, SulP family
VTPTARGAGLDRGSTGATKTQGGLIGDLAAGLLVGMLKVVFGVSLASLVFSGELEAYRANGIGLVLMSTVLVGLAVMLLGSLPGTAASAQDAPAAILAAMAAAALASMPEAGTFTRFMTVVTLVGLSTVAAGLVFLAFGLMRLGRLVRYLPYPIAGGFLAGTGWLLLTGGVGVMIGSPVGLATLPELFETSVALRWLPGVTFALVAVVASRRTRHPLTFPALVLVAVAVFYAAMAASGATMSGWRAEGLLLGPFTDAALLQPLRPADLELVRWDVVARHAAGGATVVMLTLVALLLNATALELTLGRRLDLDRELRAAGLGNLLAGSFGGMAGYHVLTFSLLYHRIGSATRRTAAIGLAVVVVTLLQGPALLEVVPTLVVGGVIAYLGLSFLIEWVYEAASRLSRVEYGIVIAILVAIAAMGFLPGVVLGLVLAVALFVVSYARVDPVKLALTGADVRSRVRRDAHDERLLAEHGATVHVIRLQGFVFFGSAHRVVEHVERRLGDEPRLASLILDFGAVTGIDASAASSLDALVRSAEHAHCRTILSDLPPWAVRLFRTAPLGADAGAGAVVATASLDEALERCEEALLQRLRVHPLEGRAAPGDELAVFADDDADLRHLVAHLERLEVAAGTRLMAQGDASEGLYLVASGRVTAWLRPTRGPPLRLETMGAGTMIGEAGLYTGAARSATVVADAPTVVYALTRERLDALATLDPRAAAALHAWVARRLAERAMHLQRAVEALQR